ncbi:MAG: alanine racemase [Desulforhopalus sp.]
MSENSFNRIKIDCARLENNFRFIRGSTKPNVRVMAMVKADGYGHGMIRSAEAFGRAGCDLFGVAELREGVLLRKAGIRGEIYVTIGFDNDDVEPFFQHRLVPVIYSHASARALSTEAVALGREIGVHVKVDTGMGRLGLQPDDLPGFLDSVSNLDGLKIAGLMSHFAESDDPDSLSSRRAIQVFHSMCRELKNRFSGICHIANSGGVLNFPDAHCDMVRAGIALYGYHPAGPYVRIVQQEKELLPAMAYHTRVLQVKEVAAGTGISYGHTYTAQRPTRIATLPVGYEDGYSRHLSNRGEVLIRGQRAKVCGRICMNMCMVDVTHIDNAASGDEAVLLGTQGEEQISADDIAEMMGSISYEVLCLLGNNNQKEYIE